MSTRGLHGDTGGPGASARVSSSAGCGHGAALGLGSGVPTAVREIEALWRALINLVPEPADAPERQSFELMRNDCPCEQRARDRRPGSGVAHGTAQ